MKPIRIAATLCLLILAGCGQNYSPKPRGFVRIELPEKEYTRVNMDFPYTFELPVYARLEPDTRPTAEPHWANVIYPAFRATIHLSYKEVTSFNMLTAYLEDARSFVNKHIPKATGIDEQLLVDPDRKVYGRLYRIRGREVASPLQFYVTDSVNHFLRGALYFNLVPNNDSLAPVIGRLEEDIRHLMDSFAWTD